MIFFRTTVEGSPLKAKLQDSQETSKQKHKPFQSAKPLDGTWRWRYWKTALLAFVLSFGYPRLANPWTYAGCRMVYRHNGQTAIASCLMTHSYLLWLINFSLINTIFSTSALSAVWMKATMNWYCGYSMFLIGCLFCISCFYTQQLSFWLVKNKKKGHLAHFTSQT